MLSLDLVKNHLNVARDFKEDDILIMTYIDVAERAVLKDLDLKDENDFYDEEGNIKETIQQSILLLIGTWYAHRESAIYGNANKVPHAFEYLNALNHDYGYKKYDV